MTLEDFFTLTEMKDGLTAPARVKELITVMQKEKDCAVNVGDATRQWSTVASTIAATENKECLDLFIQLDGLWFFDRWLKDAQKFGNDTSDSFVEESITTLLRALKKLHIDNEKSVSSGIWMTVKNLLGHTNSSVQDRAKTLFDSWQQDTDRNALSKDVENGGAICDDGIEVSANIANESGSLECSSRDISPSRGRESEEKHVEPARDEMMPSVSSDTLQSEHLDVQIQISDEILNHAINKDGLGDAVGSPVMFKPGKEDLSVKEEHPIRHSEGTASIDTCSSVDPVQDVEGKSDVPKLNEKTDDAKQAQTIVGSLDQFGEMDISSVSNPGALSSSANGTNPPNSAVEDHLNNIDSKDQDYHLKASSFGDVRTVVLEGKSGMDNVGSINHCSAQVFRTTYQGGECDSNILQDSSGSGSELGKTKDLDTSFSMVEDRGAADKVQEDASDEDGDLSDEDGDLANDMEPAMDDTDSVIERRRSDFELDYSTVDALEVARLVAIEVEREVVDRIEQSCSSSEKISEGGIRQPDSPDSINGIESQHVDGPPDDVPTGLNLCAEASPKGEEPLISVDNLDTRPELCMQDMSSQVTEAAQEPEPEGHSQKGFCDFDLNQEVCSEDMNHPVNLSSTPISVVSASRAAAAPGLPVAPLQFEGALGWKGSAATSAFRPASPRRIPDSDRSFSVGGSCNSSKQQQYCLDIDLNVAESGDDKVADLEPGKQIMLSSSLPSGESSVEVSPRRSERLKLDLNRISDDADGSSDWRMEGRLFQHRNGHGSPSPSSSSSSMQPLLRNIDLNDQPSFYNEQPYVGKSSFPQNLNPTGGLKLDDSTISIMGTRVEVSRKDLVSKTVSLPNGRISEPPIDLNLATTGSVLGMGATMPFAHSPVFGYSGLTTGHNGLTTGLTMPFSSAIYGPGGHIPYMVDSRGAPVVSQIVGSAPTVAANFSQPPFIMSMTSTFPASNGAGPSRPNFDLNSGLMMDGGSREPGHLRQLFSSGPGRSIDEHLRTNLQPSLSSGVGGKRKEPDGSWEAYPFNYKHHQPPWK